MAVYVAGGGRNPDGTAEAFATNGGSRRYQYAREERRLNRQVGGRGLLLGAALEGTIRAIGSYQGRDSQPCFLPLFT